MKKSIIIGGVLLAIAVGGCKKQENLCEEDQLTAAFVLDYPDTVQVNTAFNLNVGYVVENSCGDFGHFEGAIDGNTLEVRLKTHYSGCNCEDEFQQKSESYAIIFDEPGIYELRFWISEEQYDNYVIVAVE